MQPAALSARLQPMSRFQLHYIDAEGNRVRNLFGRHFDDLAEARREALNIVLDFLGDGRGSSRRSTFGIIEICDGDGVCLSEIHFPQQG
jgi:hypothetical protein